MAAHTARSFAPAAPALVARSSGDKLAGPHRQIVGQRERLIPARSKCEASPRTRIAVRVLTFAPPLTYPSERQRACGAEDDESLVVFSLRVQNHAVLGDQRHAAGYDVFPKLLDAVWYGVPQYRSRFFLVGLRRDLGYRRGDFGSWGPFPTPTHGPGCPRPYVTVREAIGDLPRIGNGEAAVEGMVYEEPRPQDLRMNKFLGMMRAGASPGVISDHITSRHAEYVIERYRRIPQGGNWQDIADALTNYTAVERTHSNIYRRLSWSQPSITIGHYRKSMLVHPSQHRGLSLREASRLQSFPDWFRFSGGAGSGKAGLVHKQQQLANAVCPLVTMALADFILRL